MNDNPQGLPQRKGSILLLITSLSRRPDFEVPFSVFGSLGPLAMGGWEARFAKRVGDSDLCGARNLNLAIAYVNKFDYLMMLDADVSYDALAIKKLVDWNVDLVFGAYRKKTDKVAYSVRNKPGVRELVDPHTREVRKDGLLDCDGGPGGFMLLSRKCMAGLIEAHADLWYEEDEAPGGKAWNIFEFPVRDHKRTGEDIFLCERWRALGGTVWCDPHIRLHHHGDKDYEGVFADYFWDAVKNEAEAKAANASMAVLIDGQIA
jgi:hypothetical protein